MFMQHKSINGKQEKDFFLTHNSKLLCLCTFFLRTQNRHDLYINELNTLKLPCIVTKNSAEKSERYNKSNNSIALHYTTFLFHFFLKNE